MLLAHARVHEPHARVSNRRLVGRRLRLLWRDDDVFGLGGVGQSRDELRFRAAHLEAASPARGLEIDQFHGLPHVAAAAPQGCGAAAPSCWTAGALLQQRCQQHESPRYHLFDVFWPLAKLG